MSVCLRVPTGGGKTVMAAYAVGIVKDELLHAERAIALWLVPSKTILDQTVEALRDKRHFYRRALDASCGGPVEVMRIDEALNLSRATADGASVVIVSTIQAFRVEDPTGRAGSMRAGISSRNTTSVRNPASCVRSEPMAS
jgi:type III restriction enzyme